jgi:hypothetical protein
MTKLLLAPGFSTLVIGLACLAPLAGCSGDSKDTPAPVDAGPVTCDDFVAGSYAGGTNLTDLESDGGVSPDKGAFLAFAFAANDLTVIVNEHMAKLTDACQAIALSVGADANDPAVTGKQGMDLAAGWCELASYKIETSAAIATGRPITLADDPSPVECKPAASAKAACAGACGALIDCGLYCDTSAATRGVCSADHVLVKLPAGTTPSNALIDVVRAMSKNLAEASNFKAVAATTAASVKAAQDLETRLAPAKTADGTKQQACYVKIAAAADAGAHNLETLSSAVAKLEASITKP